LLLYTCTTLHACPHRSASTLLRIRLTAACIHRNQRQPCVPLHALMLSKSNPLLGAALRSLCEDRLVGLVEVLGLALLAVL
jgi:hypothetical protein